jgi:hypothetical protein
VNRESDFLRQIEELNVVIKDKEEHFFLLKKQNNELKLEIQTVRYK